MVVGVWTPCCHDAKRPVLVYLCGGAFMARGPPVCGSVNNSAALSANGDCVNVNLNARNFGLGWLYKKGGDIPANLGLLDVIAALEWVRDEIAAFGGDPGCVTLWGESEGAAKAMLLLGSPVAAASGLFHRVQATSGGTINFQISEDEADQRAQLLSKELEIPHEELCVDKLRTIPLPQLTAAFAAVGKANRLAGPAYPGVCPFLPVACGKLYPEGSAHKSVLAGCGRDIPFFTGVNRFEQLSSAKDTAESITEKLTARVENPGLGGYEAPREGWQPADCITSYMGKQQAEGADELLTATTCLQSELSFGLGNLRFQDGHGQQNNPNTFVCRLDYGSDRMPATADAPPDHIEQTRHFCDVGFWFRKIEMFPNSYGLWNRYDHAKDESLKLQDTMSGMLLAFARSGNPSIPSFDFPAYGGEGVSNTVVLGTGDCHADVSVEREEQQDSRVSLIRAAWGNLWKVPLF